jgi:xanthine dehydrogenase accessory factor
MTQLNALLAAVNRAEQQHDDAVMATVVRVDGSAYRRAGARMLIVPQGQSVGTISGGCLEADVSKKAWWITRQDGPQLRSYSTGSVDADIDDDADEALTFGLGCNGTVHVLFERLGANSLNPVLQLLRDVHTQHRPAAIATVIGSTQPDCPIGSRILLDTDQHYHGRFSNHSIDQRIRTDLVMALTQQKSQRRLYHDGSDGIDKSGGELEVFLEYLAPPRRLVVFGAGHDVQPLVHQAKGQGWHVTVIDSRAHFAKAEHFAQADQVIAADLNAPFAYAELINDAAVAIMSHSLSQDRHWLAQVLRHSPRYVGQLGPRYRTERLIDEIIAQGDAKSIEDGLALLHYPIGLDIGGDAPEAVALSIMAEITAVMNQKSAQMLKTRTRSIHAAD